MSRFFFVSFALYIAFSAFLVCLALGVLIVGANADWSYLIAIGMLGIGMAIGVGGFTYSKLPVFLQLVGLPTDVTSTLAGRLMIVAFTIFVAFVLTVMATSGELTLLIFLPIVVLFLVAIVRWVIRGNTTVE